MEPVGVIPSDCRDLLDETTYAATLGDTPLNDPAFGVPSPGDVEPRELDPSAGPREIVLAATTLECAWGDPQADITGLSARFGEVDPVTAEALFDALPVDGYTCTDAYDGVLCRRTRVIEQYQVEESSCFFVRDGISITVVQANFPTDDLLGDLVKAIWH